MQSTTSITIYTGFETLLHISHDCLLRKLLMSSFAVLEFTLRISASFSLPALHSLVNDIFCYTSPADTLTHCSYVAWARFIFW